MTWQDYFDACADNDIYKAFEALSAVGVLPVVNGEDDKGKLKRPMADAWQKLSTDQWRTLLVGFLQNGVPVGIGAKPVGYLVLDIDPVDKDRNQLATAWREASQAIFGADDPPRTLTVKTEAGCHVWFKCPDGLIEQWRGSGKKRIMLPSGSQVELYAGIPDGGYQVACAPSEGKRISIATEPIELPEDAFRAILNLTNRPDVQVREPSEAVKTQGDYDWIKAAMDAGHLDTEVEDYDSWLRVGMALYDRFGELGAELWESWSCRSGKHVTSECFAKVSSFKRQGGNVVKFGSLVAIVRRNGGPDVPRIQEGPMSAANVEINPEAEAADCDTILALMKEREWLWGDPVANVGWFVQRGLHLVEGKEGTGKTRWLMDLKRRWGNDLKWPDGSDITMDIDAKMLFVASDSHFDQIAMTAQDFTIDTKSIIFTGPKGDPYAYTSLDDPTTIALIRHWCTKYKVGMVVIDTLMAASAKPLVDPQEVAKIAHPLRELARELNVAIVLVGHLNSQGETWGRAMGRQCDNVIRMEADEHDEQRITIRSVKARWNRFALPTIEGRQSETGWEYTTVGSDAGDDKAIGKRERAEAAVRGMLHKFGRSSWSEIQTELQDAGHVKGTIDLALKAMEKAGEIAKVKETFSSGKACTFYDFDPTFDESKE
jgi:hypothetical protein